MTEHMLNAIARTVNLVRCGYSFSEALDYGVIYYDLDEFQREDLEVMSRNQLARLIKQTNGEQTWKPFT